jgi:hypothetical protein
MGKCKRGGRPKRRRNRSATQSRNDHSDGSSTTSVSIRQHWKRIRKLLDNPWLQLVIKVLRFAVTHADAIAHFLHMHGPHMHG